MRIASVNAAVRGGGAEHVAHTLHRAYLERGHDSWLIVGNLNEPTAGAIAVQNEQYRSRWARSVRRAAALADRKSQRRHDFGWYGDRALRSLAEPLRFARVARGHEDFDHPGTAHIIDLLPGPPDVLHLHNLHGSYFDIRALPMLTHRIPSILTFHDAWWLTGHCAHPFECERWLNGCETCPHLERYVPLIHDSAASNFRLKRKVLQASRLTFVAPSRWMLDMANRSGVTERALSTHVIPNGVDTSVFAPGDRADARRQLGLPAETLVLATAGRNLIDNPYKGFDVLQEACAALSASGVEGIVLAIGSEGSPERIGGMEIRPVAQVDDPSLLARYYRAADVYVHPARAEVLGVTILEAMACGLPVIGSRVGGIPEILDDGDNGLLVAPGNPSELAQGILLLLGDESLRNRMGDAGVRRVTAQYTIQAQVDAHLRLYAELQSETPS